MIANDVRILWDQQFKEKSYPVFMNGDILDIVEPSWELRSYESLNILPDFRKKKFGISYFLQPFLTRTLCGYEKIETKYWNGFFPKICQFNIDRLPIGIPDNWEIKEMKFQRMSLDIPLEEIEKRYSENVRRVKKKLISHTLETEVTLSQYFDFIKRNNQFFSKMKTELFSKFKKLIMYFDANDLGEIIAIKDENGKFTAMSYYIFDNETVIDFKGAVTRDGKKRGAMVILHMKAISKFHGTFKVYDFYGANSSGRAHFNRKFGGHNVIYYQLTRLDYPKPIKYLIRKIWSI